MGVGFLPRPKKSFFKEWIGWDIVVLLMIMFGTLGVFFWNANRATPPRQTHAVEKADEYTIITDKGKCKVVTDYSTRNESTILMEGDYLGECEMYLKNLKL